jgi:hypothetical protein
VDLLRACQVFVPSVMATAVSVATGVVVRRRVVVATIAVVRRHLPVKVMGGGVGVVPTGVVMGGGVGVVPAGVAVVPGAVRVSMPVHPRVPVTKRRPVRVARGGSRVVRRRACLRCELVGGRCHRRQRGRPRGG